LMLHSVGAGETLATWRAVPPLAQVEGAMLRPLSRGCKLA
jgi:hypothetical protein